MKWSNPYRWAAALLRNRRHAEAEDADSNVDEDEWVGEALSYVKAGRSVVVVAPTGSGKTRVGIGALKLRGGGWYLAPTRALCYEKAREIAAQTQRGWEAVAVANRDTPNSVNTLLRARYRVATPHKLSQLLADIPPTHWEHTVIVVDEAHSLDPKTETLITYLAASGAQIVALTATLREEDEQAYAEFVGGGREGAPAPARVIRYRGPRRVPIEYKLIRITPRPGGGSSGSRNGSGGGGEGEGEGEGGGGWYTPYGYRRSVEEFAASYAYRLHAEEPGASIIVWAPRRRTCDTLAEMIARTQPIIATHTCGCTAQRVHSAGGGEGDPPPTAAVALNTPSDTTLAHTLPHGVGVHHGGLTPTNRELVHRLYRARGIHTLCTAYTLTQGVNLPARHLILTGLRGPRGEPLDPTTFHQLAGRAGRPGLDSRGVVHIILTSDEDEKLAATLTATPAAPLRSRLGEQSPRFYERLAAQLIARGNNTPRRIAQALRHTYYSEAGGPREWAALARHMRRAVDTLIARGAIRVKTRSPNAAQKSGEHSHSDGKTKRSLDEEYEFTSPWWREAAKRGLSTQEAKLAEAIPTLPYEEAVTRTLTVYAEAEAGAPPLSGEERRLIASLGLLAQYHPHTTPRTAEAAEAVQSFLDTATLIHAHTKGWSHPDTLKARRTAQRFASGGGSTQRIAQILGDQPHAHAKLKQLIRTYGQHLTPTQPSGGGRGIPPAEAERALTILLGHPKTWGPSEQEKADRLRRILLSGCPPEHEADQAGHEDTDPATQPNSQTDRHT